MILRYGRDEMRRLWDAEVRLRRMLDVEVAFLEGLAKEKKVPRAEMRALKAVVASKAPLAPKVIEKEKKSAHDVVALLQVITDRLRGKAPKVVQYLHYGLTSSDVLDTALGMQMRDAADVLLADWARVKKALKRLARRHKATWMVGRTHGIHAEPTTFGLKVAGWHAEARRNIERIKRVREEVSFGKLSGAVGTYAHFPPSVERAILKKLGLKPEAIATQVIPRDRHADFFSALVLSACAIERFATEIRHLQRTEVREAAEPFGRGQKGSSAMPHKRNPVLCENLCGLARLIRGHATPMYEDVALWHERDISHSSVERVALPDAAILLDFMLHRFAGVAERLDVFKDRMTQNLEDSLGLVFSQKMLLTLIDKGLGRLDAYDIVQRNAMATLRTRGQFQRALSEDKEVQRHMTQREIGRVFDLKTYGRSIDQVLKREGIL